MLPLGSGDDDEDDGWVFLVATVQDFSLDDDEDDDEDDEEDDEDDADDGIVECCMTAAKTWE